MRKDSFQVIMSMNEWLLFKANKAIFQLYHGKLIFNEIYFVLDQQA
jgi:hypothetical protein